MLLIGPWYGCLVILLPLCTLRSKYLFGRVGHLLCRLVFPFLSTETILSLVSKRLQILLKLEAFLSFHSEGFTIGICPLRGAQIAFLLLFTPVPHVCVGV